MENDVLAQLIRSSPERKLLFHFCAGAARQIGAQDLLPTRSEQLKTSKCISQSLGK